MSPQTPLSRQRSLERERAAAARGYVQRSVVEKRYAGNERDRDFAKGYARAARSAGADFLSNGMGQTLSFWKAKGQKETCFLQLYEDLSGWLSEKMALGGRSLLDWVITTAEPATYRRAQKEALALLAWVKRFAEAEMPEED